MRKLTQAEFIKKCKAVHGDRYDYSVSVYKSARGHVEISCKTHGCFRQIVYVHYMGRGCPKCAEIARISTKKKTLFDRKINGIGDIDVPAGCEIIPLTKGFYSVIDKEDFNRANLYTWHYNKGYAEGEVNGVRTSLHRFLINLSDSSIHVDHRDTNPLNNRKSNLRTCTLAENNRNTKSRKGTSKYKGVCWQKNTLRWSAEIRSHGVRYKLGLFNNEENAAKAYDAKAIELHGEFARTNFKT